MEELKNLLRELKENKITVSLDGKDLKVKFYGDGLPERLIGQLKQNKERIVQYLAELNNETPDPAIEPLPAGEHYPLSSSQRRLLILDQFEEGRTAYNIPGIFLFKGEFLPESLAYSFNSLIARHETLRTVFGEDEQGELRQFIRSATNSELNIPYLDLRGDENWEEQVADLLPREIAKPFDLSGGPLIRVGLYQVADDKWVFFYVMHHIITDGWSMNILIRELLALYNAHSRDEINTLPPLKIQYKDYAFWQQAQLSGTASAAHKEYWLNQLSGVLPVLELPSDNIRPAIMSYNGGVISRDIPSSLVTGLRELNLRQGSTLFMNLLAAVNVLLYKYTGQTDIIIGSTIAGREHVDLEDQIGFYVNTLALRTRFKGEDNFEEVMGNVKQMTLQAYEHQMYPFDELVHELRLKRDVSRSPLFDVSIDFQDAGIEPSLKKQQMGGLEVTSYKIRDHVVSKYDLTFIFREMDGALNLSLEYNAGLFKRETIERMYIHFENLLGSIIVLPGIPVGQLKYIGEEERDMILGSFSMAPENYEQYIPVATLFEQQALRTPDNAALLFGDLTLTYRELNEQADRLAAYLREKNDAGKEELVGIMLDRSEKMIIAILGVLKSGAAYVPIDPAYPDARKEYILKDTEIKTLLTQTEYADALGYFGEEIFRMDIEMDRIEVSGAPAGVIHHPEDMAYVIYTSGSTGEPKGCTITNNNLSNYIQWANAWYFGKQGKPNFGLYTSLSFDLTVTSIFCCLTQGGSLLIYDQQEDLTSILGHSFSEESGVDSIKLTPSHISLLKNMDIGSSAMIRAIVGGEQITASQVSVLKGINPDMEIYNEYGPTEATVGCIVKKLEEDAPILIGRPIAHTDIYILGEDLSLCPVGVPGEICIGGRGLAKEYLNKPELTSEKFIVNPFQAGGRLYRTGDIARWLLDGDIGFIGRKDDQVKIRGYRVELGEIETALQRHAMVDSAVVIVRPDKEGENVLVAYMVIKGALHAEEIRSWLNEILPFYMVPDHFVQLEQLPLTINGKIDRKSLPDPDGSELPTNVEYVPPRNEIEEKLVSVWKDVLGKEKIGVKDNFFDLGGNSLRLLKTVRLINRILDREVSVVLLFRFPNIRALADYLYAADTADETAETDKEARVAMNIMEDTFKSLK